jgi:hypothetical protein
MDHAAKYPCSLLGVVGANTERHQTLTDKFVLIRILWTQGLGEGVPQLLEDNYELFRLDVPITSFPSWQWFSSPLTRRVESRGHLFLEYLGVTSYAPENPQVRKLPGVDDSSWPT